MKKFEFQLEKLLSYKEQLLEGEKINLASLNRLLREKQEALWALEEELQERRRDYERKMQEPFEPSLCRTHERYQRATGEKMEACRGEIDVILDRIRQQIELLADLSREIKSLENLKASRYEEYLKEGIKKEERLLDEFVARERIVGQTF